VGLFIAIEGGDGSGKGTQAKILTEYVASQGVDVYHISFPRYGNPSAYYVERYLNGDYGQNDQISADLGVLPFALDRFAARDDIRKHLQKPNSLVIADRYMASNLAHQGTKVDNTDERQKFYKRTMLTEYNILDIPRPDLNIVLLVPAETAQANVDKKEARTYTNKKRDIHEADKSHLEKAKTNYEELCKLYPNEFTAIHCTNKDGAMRPIDDIQHEIRDLIPKH
jgi:dTMP kinase